MAFRVKGPDGTTKRNPIAVGDVAGPEMEEKGGYGDRSK